MPQFLFAATVAVALLVLAVDAASHCNEPVSDMLIASPPKSLDRMRVLRNSRQCGPAFLDSSPSPFPRLGYATFANVSYQDYGCGRKKPEIKDLV